MKNEKKTLKNIFIFVIIPVAIIALLLLNGKLAYRKYKPAEMGDREQIIWQIA